MAHNLELGDLGGVHGEGALDADTEGNLANGKGLASTGAAHANHIALIHLNTLAVAFLDAVVDLDVVAHADLRKILTNLLALDRANVVHLLNPFLNRHMGSCACTPNLHSRKSIVERQ